MEKQLHYGTKLNFVRIDILFVKILGEAMNLIDRKDLNKLGSDEEDS